MNIKGNFALLVFMLIGWGVLILLFWYLSKAKPKGPAAAILLGPIYFVLKRQDWKFSKREIQGWGLVFVFMLIAPFLSLWLER